MRKIFWPNNHLKLNISNICLHLPWGNQIKYGQFICSTLVIDTLCVIGYHIDLVIMRQDCHNNVIVALMRHFEVLVKARLGDEILIRFATDATNDRNYFAYVCFRTQHVLAKIVL